MKCIVLITHLGRPAGNINVKEYTVEPIVNVLKENLPGVEVKFLKDCVGADIEAATRNCKPNTVFLCENLRFHPEETGMRVSKKENGEVEKYHSTAAEKIAFRKGLSQLGDVFVFEAFGAAHRPHASIIGIDLPQRVAGLLMHREMSYYGAVLSKPQRPFLAIIGGAKVSDKILVLENLLNLVDEMIIGGGMAYTFLRIINNVQIGDSLFDSDGAGVVHRIIEKARERGVKLHLPVDHIIGDKFASDAKIGVTDNERGIPPKWMGLDVGMCTRIAACSLHADVLILLVSACCFSYSHSLLLLCRSEDARTQQRGDLPCLHRALEWTARSVRDGPFWGWNHLGVLGSGRRDEARSDDDYWRR